MGKPAKYEPDDGDMCPRCDQYLPEVAVRRVDTGEARQVCRACARTLAEVTGIEVLGLGGIPRPGGADRHTRVSDECITEARLHLAILHHIEDQCSVDCRRLARRLSCSSRKAGVILRKLETNDDVDAVGRRSGRKRYRITM